MNPQNGRLHGLDHLRAIAISLVLVFHYKIYYGVPDWLNGFSSFGWSGVDLFFVLSGYLITDKLLSGYDKSGYISIKKFYYNRFFRIIPAYTAVILIYFTFPIVREGRGLQPLWKFLTFTQNIDIDTYLNTFSHAWSLCVEEHFYLILPVFLSIILFKKMTDKGFFIFIAFFVFGIVVRYLNWEFFIQTKPDMGYQKMIYALKHIYYPTYTRLDGLLVGVAIAVIFKYRPRIRDRLANHSNLLLLTSLLLLFITYIQFGGSVLSERFTHLNTILFGFPLVSLGYGLMMISVLSPASPLYKFQFKPSKIIATLSYSIYLIHKITNHLVNTKLTVILTLNKDQLFFVSLFAAVAGGLALYTIVEKPFLLFRERFKLS